MVADVVWLGVVWLGVFNVAAEVSDMEDVVALGVECEVAGVDVKLVDVVIDVV